MSRPRTPLHVLEARGSTKKDPQRYRERQEYARNAPKPEPIGPPPERWNVPPEAMGAIKFARWKAIWMEFAPQVRTRTPMRRALLEQFVIAMDKFRTNPEGMKTSEKNNLLALTTRLETDERMVSSPAGASGENGVWEEYG